MLDINICIEIIKHKPTDIMQKLQDLDIEVLATVGAGDIDLFVKPIRELLMKK